MDCNIMYVYYGDSLVSKIMVESGKVSFENYTDDIILLPFGCRDKASLDDLNHFLESRCFPRTRFNCKEILDAAGLQYYNPLEIVKLTHGAMTDDLFWIRFEGEELTWEQVNPRNYL